MFRVIGDDNLFKNEVGGHRIQAPSGNKNKTHTSSITISVLPEIKEYQLKIKNGDLDWKFTRSRGKGGQSVNTTDSCCQLTHIPSGLSVRCENEKSQAQNKITALEILRSKLWEHQQNGLASERSSMRKEQVGMGQRGDKRRTVAHQRGEVIDNDGRRWKLKDYLKGNW